MNEPLKLQHSFYNSNRSRFHRDHLVSTSAKSISQHQLLGRSLTSVLPSQFTRTAYPSEINQNNPNGEPKPETGRPQPASGRDTHTCHPSVSDINVRVHLRFPTLASPEHLQNQHANELRLDETGSRPTIGQN